MLLGPLGTFLVVLLALLALRLVLVCLFLLALFRRLVEPRGLYVGSSDTPES